MLTVPCRRWTTAPTGFMNRLTTMSLEIAVSGSTPKKNTSIGVMSAPPPMPGEADDDADEQPADDEREVEGHARRPRRTRAAEGCEACGG